MKYDRSPGQAFNDGNAGQTEHCKTRGSVGRIT